MSQKIADQIIAWANSGDEKREIARKLYLILPTAAFLDNADDQYRVFSRVSDSLGVPISAVQIVGSAKTGISLVKGTRFRAAESDLDIAIVDPGLYIRMMEVALKVSKSFNDGLLWEDKLSRDQFLFNLQRGIFVPRLMPRCSQKTEWITLFGDLTRDFKALFKSVSAYVYASETFFEAKQIEAVKHFLSTKGIVQ
ncbi:MAG: hypothetical protein JNM76_03995 [Betaproteobacteria bacterium]|nr:hypothetical protein [Betaproteobacteria bacterium]